MLKLLLTCEHGGNQVPAEYQALFGDYADLLNTHEGYDIGALDLFDSLREMADISFFSQTTRLLVEQNRSLTHKKLFSDITRSLPEEEKKKILNEYYYPYRDRVEQLVHDFVSGGRRVLHIAVHTFTPVLYGEERQADVGLLYDPKRNGEQAFCRTWKKLLQAQDEALLIRFNYPYLGISDGFPTYLRRKFSEQDYIGIELEVNQRFPLGDVEKWNDLKHNIRTSLADTLKEHCPQNASDEY